MGDAAQGPGDVTGVEDGAAVVGAAGAGTGCGWWQAQAFGCQTSFSASRDGSLKDVDRGDPTSREGLVRRVPEAVPHSAIGGPTTSRP